jgi:hemerythrin
MNISNEPHAASMRGKAKQVAGSLLHHFVSLANQHFSVEEM